MAKKQQIKQVVLSEREENFVQMLLDGADILEAYRANWKNGYTDIKARHEAKKILDRNHVQARMQNLVVERQADVTLDEKFVIDILKKTALQCFGTTAGTRAAELLGKYLAMWTDRQVIDDKSSHAKQADDSWDRYMRHKNGEVIEDEKEEEVENVYEFSIKDGTDD